MWVALVSPYSWTYPGGVTRHIESLAVELLAAGHHVRVLAPFDHDSRRAAWLHRGVRPQQRAVPEWLIPLGGTVGLPANGAISNLSFSPRAVATMRRELRQGNFDVVHIHEPVAPAISWDAVSFQGAPLVGTFHTYNEKALPHWIAGALGARRKFNRLTLRIAVSEAAEWTGRRYWGGSYRIIPNGVSLPPGGVPSARERGNDHPFRIVFVGQAVERKGLPSLLRAFEALREEVSATLTIVGAELAEVEPLLLDKSGVTALGRVCDEHKHAALAQADVLCAPSLRGESFGMVLTESFAAGTPVIASDIAGYRDVVSDGENGVLIPPADPEVLAKALHELALNPVRLRAIGKRAGESAQRYAWPNVAQRIVGAYEDACSVPAPETALKRLGVRIGALPADLGPRRPPVRLARLDDPPSVRTKSKRWANRARVIGAAGIALMLTFLALNHIGFDSIVDSVLASSPIWALIALSVMCVAMVSRAVAWRAILRAAVPDCDVTMADSMQGTSISVLMSATLPARLGELSRALIVSRRLGNPREYLPIVVGTLVSQTLLNIVALIILGSLMFATVGLFAERQQALLWYSLVPVALVCLMFIFPAILRYGFSSDGSLAQRWQAQTRATLLRVRAGLRVFRHPRLGLIATVAQLTAWALQWLSCYLLFVAFGLHHSVGLIAAAAVLFAVNITAVLPVTPSNIGVFQAACVVVLTKAYGIDAADALAYGFILQLVEIATAIILGAPALLKEGLSWREVRLRALHTAPVSLSGTPSARKAEI